MVNNYKTIATHDGSFHADECMAVAVLKKINPSLNVVRTRDAEKIKSLDARVDIGFNYNPATNDYDHHQKGGAGVRENKVPYASAGLVWKEFGRQLVNSEESQNYVDYKIMQPIDAEDNGIRPDKKTPFFSLGELVRAYNSRKDGFEKAVQTSSDLLDSIIEEGNNYGSNVELVKKGEKLADGKIIIVSETPKGDSWQNYVVPNTNASYFVYPHESGDWRVRAVPTEIDGFEPRTPFPDAWRGKSS